MKNAILLFALMSISICTSSQNMVGISIGSTSAIADVDYDFKYTNSLGINYTTFIGKHLCGEAEISYSSMSGLDEQAWSTGLVEPVYDGLANNPFQPNYNNNIWIIDTGLSLNISFLRFQKLSLKIGLGTGLSYSNVNVNIKDEDGLYYNNTHLYLGKSTGFVGTPNTIYTLYDESYETDFDNFLAFHGYFSTALYYNIYGKYSIGFKSKFRMTNSDYLDAIHWRAAGSRTKSNDFIHSIFFILSKEI